MNLKESYDLSNHIKIPYLKKKEKSAYNATTFYGIFSVPSALRSSF